MKFSKPITDIIRERTSWRTYYPELLKEDIKADIKKILEQGNLISPFSSKTGNCRFELVSVLEFDPNEQKKLGTYGMISGVQEFIVGASEKSKYNKLNFGFLMELIILKATDLGLGTCWLGGTFNRTIFSKKVNCTTEEIIPAITPIGYPAKRRSREKIIRSMIKAKKRKPWEEIFFNANFQNPLSNDNLNEYSTVLEMVRLGPSAGNGQPWRILKEENKNTFHFYVENPKGKLAASYRPFVKLDMGIAACHFDLTAKEYGLKGGWHFTNPDIPLQENLEYITSWKSE
ncbi:MAG: nitroreductase [Candidatus Lokiarchaeota archaeon]|nr:nitroreductase [Candidatus Lokiarchaeota archaeon]